MWDRQQLQILDGLGIAAWLRRDQSLSDWVINDDVPLSATAEAAAPAALESKPSTATTHQHGALNARLMPSQASAPVSTLPASAAQAATQHAFGGTPAASAQRSAIPILQQAQAQTHSQRSSTSMRADARPAAPVLVSSTRPIVMDDRRKRIATLDWTTLQEDVAGCTACQLCNSRTQTVFGTGHEQADWMIVGEAPGEQEDLQGKPFVGQAGKLLDAMLAAIELSRAPNSAEKQVFIANVLKCRPPKNRNPEPEEVAKCEPYLQRQIELVKPKIILAMGRFAVQSLLQTKEAIGRLRGRVHHYHGVPLIVTYHPAYLLRNLSDKSKAWEDLCLAIETRRTIA